MVKNYIIIINVTRVCARARKTGRATGLSGVRAQNDETKKEKKTDVDERDGRRSRAGSILYF